MNDSKGLVDSLIPVKHNDPYLTSDVTRLQATDYQVVGGYAQGIIAKKFFFSCTLSLDVSYLFNSMCLYLMHQK